MEINMNYLEALAKLGANHQEHLLRYYSELSSTEKDALLYQIEQFDFSEIENLRSHKYKMNISDLQIIETLTVDDTKKRAICTEIGKKALAKGKMGIVILSGGQGSRLGFQHAKGMYNIGIKKTITIFEMHIRRLLHFKEETGVLLHCFIMTSSHNNKEIEQFFEKNNYFGYDKNYIHFYIQGNNITVDRNWNPMLSDKSTICYSPNGNGCWYMDLVKAGYRELLETSGIEWLNVVSVDNVLQNFVDPTFLGAVLYASAGCGAKVVSKICADEKIGVICINGGHPDVLEYYEIPDDVKGAVDATGQLLYRYGVILNYIFHVAELDCINYSELPVHIVKKKVAYVDDNGTFVKPDEENAWKFEYLLTDLIAHTSSCVAFEVERDKEFAPIKNLTGIDSVESARRLLQKNNILL